MTVVERSSSMARRLWMHRSRSAEVVWVASGQGLAAVGALVGVRLLTSLMPPAAYGELALAMTVVTLFQQTLVLPVNSAALRFLVPAQTSGQVDSYVRALRWLVKRSVFVVLLVGTLSSAALWLSPARSQVSLAIAATLFTAVVGVGLVIDGVQNAARRRLVTAWHDTISSWSRFLLAALFLYWARSHSSALAMAGYVASAVLTLISQAFIFPPRLLESQTLSPNGVESMRKQMINFAMPLSFFGLSFALQMASERWSLGYFGSTAQVGQYAVLVQIGYYPVITLSNFLVQLATPIVYARAGDGAGEVSIVAARRLVARFLGLVAGFTLLAAACALALHSLLFKILVASQYRGVSVLLPLVVTSAGLLACGQVAALSLMVEGRTRDLVAPKLTTGLVTAVGSFVGAQYLGVMGVVAAGVVSASLYCVWILTLARRRGVAAVAPIGGVANGTITPAQVD